MATRLERINNVLQSGTPAEIAQAYIEAIGRGMVDIVRFELTQSATRNDRARNSLSDSNLIKSVEYSLTDTGIDLLANFYWIFIEGGRRPGTYPPRSALYFWAVRYGIKPRAGETIDQMVIKIQKAIFKRGIQPRPFIENAFTRADKFLNPFNDEFAEALISNTFK